ncbi:MAG: YceI family protein, partial [Brevundimonas sp.]|nr:YceI family protein [Brevundimonas sp.]
MRRRAVLAFAVLALLTQTGATAIPWMIDRDASRIEMSVQAFGGSHSGRFADWRGDIVFDPTDPEGTRATVVVQSASLAMSPAVASRR